MPPLGPQSANDLPFTRYLATSSFMRIADVKDLLMHDVATARRKRQKAQTGRYRNRLPGWQFAVY
jgi:hypothetical protein